MYIISGFDLFFLGTGFTVGLGRTAAMESTVNFVLFPLDT
jgi:hypothetical protein